MKCEICGKGMAEGKTLHRVNEKGVKGVWRCNQHLSFDQEANLDPEVRDIVRIIEADSREKGFET